MVRAGEIEGSASPRAWRPARSRARGREALERASFADGLTAVDGKHCAAQWASACWLMGIRLHQQAWLRQHLTIILVAPLQLLERVRQALRLKRFSGPGKKCFQACDIMWGKVCATCAEDPVPEVTALRGKALGHRVCHLAGMCICGDRGTLLERLRGNIDSAAKLYFGQGRARRQLLGNARVVFAFFANERSLRR